MSLFPKAVYNALKTELSNASALPYVDLVTIRKYNRANMPDFNYYCIIISPVSAVSEPYPASQRWIQNDIDLVLLGKILYTEEDAIIADSPSATPPKVGILAMYEDIYNTLYENNLGGVIELLPGLIELDSPAKFDILTSAESDVHLIEAHMKYKPRGERFVDLS